MFFVASTANEDKFEMTVRIAQMKDISELANTIVSCFYDFPPILSWVNSVLKLTLSEDLRYRLKKSPSLYCCFVAIKKSEIAGAVEISLQKPWWSITTQFPYISNLAVKNIYRRQGIATKMLTHCEHVSRSWGYQEIRLHVLSDNHAAKKLYLGLGYKIIPEEMNWYCWLPHYSSRLLMKKELGNLS
ncbi:acetyltransferase [Xenococcus sp. PCC 7305]|uniref:GNAT family N-acetyltransferase n=1 Tax=Xenococcus sp. PCC 7305 TaxID=102125 RepID=UPI0002AC3FDE|nr:N-acetyltransferase [Xenococcus sp. PCC 7305]ELS04174.1 acetyltransferase [Xenococcus sp. PCC 7305]